MKGILFRKLPVAAGKRVQTMRIWIRADANEEIASGHLARTLSIAGELRRLGVRVRFVLSDEESRSWLQRLSGNPDEWEVSVLGLSYGKPGEELPLLAKLAEREQPDWILVDSYAVSGDWFEQLRSTLAAALKEKQGAENPTPGLAFLDDERAFDPAVDLVINYDPDAESLQSFYQKAPFRLLGPKYAPLREQFADLRPAVRPSVRKILISTGGTDPYGMAKRLQKLVQCVPETAVMAPGYPRVEKVAELLLGCDLAISAAGTTLYELCAAGVPTLAFSMSDNQELFAKQMAAAGAVTYLGDIRKQEVLAELEKNVASWLSEHGAAEEHGLPEARKHSTGEALLLRQQESARMHALTDGLGSRRIAEKLIQISDGACSGRKDRLQ